MYWYFYDENAKLLGRLRELEDRESSIIREWESRLEMEKANHAAQLAEQRSTMEAAMARLKRDHEAALLAQMKEHNDAMSAAAAKHAATLQVRCMPLFCLLEGCIKGVAADLSAEIQEMANKMSAMAAEHSDALKSQAEQNSRELGRLAKELHDATQRASILEAEKGRLEAELERSTSMVLTLEQRLVHAQGLLKEMDALKQKNTAMELQIQDFMRDRAELDAARAALAAAQEDATRARKQCSELEMKLQDWDRERAELEGQVKAAQDMAVKIAGANQKLQGELLDQIARSETDAVQMQGLKEKVNKIGDLEQAVLVSHRTIKDLEDCINVLRPENERVAEVLEQSKGEIARLRAVKTEMLAKHSSMERSLQDQIFDMMDERNSYKAELEHFYALPNPCGVGLQLQGPKETVDFSTSGANTHTTLVTVIDILPGMSAAQCGMIALGDKVQQVDGIPAGGKTPEEIKTMIAGKRGTRVKLTFRRMQDLSEYTVVLKRGAWGPEHVEFIKSRSAGCACGMLAPPRAQSCRPCACGRR